MTTDAIHLAVWRDCLNCDGTGKNESADSRRCPYCHYGKFATYIPIDELVNLDSAINSLAMVRSIRNWMTGHDQSVDQLAAELEASGLVPDVPPKVSGVEDRVRAEELPEGAWPKHPANVKGQQSLEFGLEQIVANSCPSASMAKMDHAGNPVDDRDERLQGIYAVALDVLAQMRGIGEESGLVPDAATPALDGIFYGPEDLTRASHPEANVTGMVRTLLKRACIDDADQVEYLMDGLVPIFQLARQDARPLPDLAVAACELMAVIGRSHFMGGVKSGKTEFMEAAKAVADALECLDGRGVEPDQEGGA